MTLFLSADSTAGAVVWPAPQILILHDFGLGVLKCLMCCLSSLLLLPSGLLLVHHHFLDHAVRVGLVLEDIGFADQLDGRVLLHLQLVFLQGLDRLLLDRLDFFLLLVLRGASVN